MLIKFFLWNIAHNEIFIRYDLAIFAKLYLKNHRYSALS